MEAGGPTLLGFARYTAKHVLLFAFGVAVAYFASAVTWVVFDLRGLYPIAAAVVGVAVWLGVRRRLWTLGLGLVTSSLVTLIFFTLVSRYGIGPLD